MAFSDARNERDRTETGKNSSNHGGRDNAGAERRNREAMARGERGTPSQQQDRRNMQNARHAGNVAPGVAGSRGRYSDARDDPVAQENRARNLDAQNVGESWGDGVAGVANELGHLVGGLLGFDEREEGFAETAMDMARSEYQGPVPGTPDNARANWGFDVMEALTNFAGLASGLPVNSVYKGVKYGYETLTGNRVPTDINLGRSVFGREDLSPTQAGAPPSQGGQRADLNNDKGGKGKGRNNGLIGFRPGTPQQAQQPQGPRNPTTPPTTTPPAGGPSKLPTPQQKFQAPSYYAGDWQFDETTQQVVWVPKRNGLLAA
jgi:hypothetical protein